MLFWHKLISAPLSIKRWTLLECPSWQAVKRGLFPLESNIFKLALLFNKNCKMLSCPSEAIKCRMFPYDFRQKLISTPLSNNNFETLRWPPRTYIRKGLAPLDSHKITFAPKTAFRTFNLLFIFIWVFYWHIWSKQNVKTNNVWWKVCKKGGSNVKEISTKIIIKCNVIFFYYWICSKHKYHNNTDFIKWD